MTHEDVLTKIYDEMLTQLKELLRRINLMIGRKSVDVN